MEERTEERECFTKGLNAGLPYGPDGLGKLEAEAAQAGYESVVDYMVRVMAKDLDHPSDFALGMLAYFGVVEGMEGVYGKPK